MFIQHQINKFATLYRVCICIFSEIVRTRGPNSTRNIIRGIDCLPARVIVVKAPRELRKHAGSLNLQNKHFPKASATIYHNTVKLSRRFGCGLCKKRMSLEEIRRGVFLWKSDCFIFIVDVVSNFKLFLFLFRWYGLVFRHGKVAFIIQGCCKWNGSDGYL